MLENTGVPSRCAAPVSGRAPLTRLERAILLTTLYADLFDYPLTERELHRHLVGDPVSYSAFQQAVARLEGTYLRRTSGYIVWKGREALVEVRRRRQMTGALWKEAQRYARWLACVPFVRMVAVSGSLAVENAEDKSDIDLFCITDTRRLWIARLCIVPLSKMTRLLPRVFPLYLCPNYILALDALAVPEHNLFTAHEVVQAVPLWGRAVHQQFRAANPWVRTFLPHARADGYSRHAAAYGLAETARPRLTRWCEQLLRGPLGDKLDRSIYRLFVWFYRRRARQAGWSWCRLAPAYQRSRYTVPEGGYVRVVQRLFARRVREHLGPLVSAGDLHWLFAGGEVAPEASCYDWEVLFAREYGRREADVQEKNGMS